MKVFANVDELRAFRWENTTLSWGVVPTLGGLHEGHRSLVRRARQHNDRVGVSVFLNPTQFAPGEDFSTYPQSLEQDLHMLQSERVDAVWTPSEQDVYPQGFETVVRVQRLDKVLEGASRPEHFAGVCTVVAIIFNVFQPTRVYFGQKDAQQVAVLKRMLTDLKYDIEFVTCPTVREPDGLALSTRNQNLNAPQRQAASVLYRALSQAEKLFLDGQRDAKILKNEMRRVIEAEPLARLDYVSVAHPDTLQEAQGIVHHALLSGAIVLGDTRLIDNLVVGEHKD